MIFFSNAEGTINAVVSSPVYQGSNYANEVVFVAPFVPVSVVTVLFIKPNGEYTPTALMTVKELTGIKDEKGNAFNAWTYLVPEAYTEYSGVLTAQFKVTNGNTVLATASSSFNVQKGVPNVTPEPPEDIYQQILSALSEIKQDIANLEDGTTEVGKAKEAEKAEQAEYYTTASGDKSVNTIEAQFSNKLDKQTGVPSYPQVYAVEGNTQKLIPVSNGSTIAPNDRIAQYTSSGTLFTQPPETDSDTTNKGYVDGEIKKSNDEQMVINERIVEILDGIEIVKVNDLEYNLMVDETIKGTINIPKDQFLKSVSYDPETHVLTFIFLTSDGEVPTPIDMSSLVDVYQAGNGLTLANNTFSIKLDPSSNNALTLSAAGLMLDNTPLEKAAEDIEILNSDIPKSAKETGVFISGNNTLAGAKAEVSVESKNLFTTAGFRETWQGTTVQNGTNGFTYTRDPNSTQSSYVEYYCETPNGEITISFETSITGSMTDKRPNMFYVFDGLPIVGAQIAIVNLGEDQTNQSHVVTVKATKGGISFRFYANVLATTETGGEYTAVFENVQFESGASATAFTPYLPAGTAVEVQACGKNLLNPATFQNGQEYIGVTLTNNQDGTITLNGTSAATSYFSIFSTNADAHTPIPEYLKGKRITLSLETNGNDLNDCTFVTWAGEINNFIDDFSETKILSTTIQPDVTDWSIRIKLKSGQTYNNILYKIMVTFGEYAGSLYIPYKSLTYPAAVGETIEVEQYDRITNIFSNTTGGAVCTQFLQSTRYELETKPVSLAGTYAKRPTGTYPYVVLYTATDTGRTYRLERDTDGSVSSNWVNISSAGGTGGGFTPRGEWNSTTTYNENDLVSLNGSSYMCIEENTNATPASNPDKWMVNAEKGATGATGATGTTGPAGTDGHSVYTATDTCSAEVGVECEVYKDSTNAKGVGDVIINASGRVFTVTGEDVHEGKPTWAGPVTAIINGPQGPAGANGTNGKDYLIYKGDTFTGTSTPERFATTVSNDDFNRAPVTGEYFNALYKETSSTYGDKLSYCIFEVALAAESGTLVSVFETERIDTKKYLHRVSVNLGEGLCWFQFVNNVSTNYTDEDVVDAIYRYGAQADVVAIQASGYFSEKIVVGVYAPTASNQIYIWLSSGEASNIVVGTGSVTDQVVEL